MVENNENKELKCLDWRNLSDDDYECVCPNCGYIFIYTGVEPFECGACDSMFILGNHDEVWENLCVKCIHQSFSNDLNIPDVCLECEKQNNFEPRKENNED